MSTIPLEGDPGMLVCRCASEIEPERVEWLWPGRIAVGKHTCIAGEPGTGKSQLATDIAARISMGGEWPCGEGRSPQGSVIILSAEDGEGDTVVPRLLAAEADLGRVHIISAVRTDYKSTRGFNLQADIELLEQKIAELGDVALITIDPISSYLGKTDSHKNAEVRGVLEPLSAMAERMRVAVLSVTHFSKSGAANTTKALHRFIGSIAFVVPLEWPSRLSRMPTTRTAAFYCMPRTTWRHHRKGWRRPQANHHRGPRHVHRGQSRGLGARSRFHYRKRGLGGGIRQHRAQTERGSRELLARTASRWPGAS